MSIERTRTYCHACGDDFTAELDMALNGNHLIPCPHCGHEHYRVIEDGHVTAVRWGSANRPYNAGSGTPPQFVTTATTYATISNFISSDTSGFIAASWDDTTSTATYYTCNVSTGSS